MCNAGFYGDTNTFVDGQSSRRRNLLALTTTFVDGQSSRRRNLLALTPVCSVCPANSYCPGLLRNQSITCPYGQFSFSGSSNTVACTCPGNASAGVNATNVDHCTCNANFQRVEVSTSPLATWSCQACNSTQICWNDTVSSCPQGSSSSVPVTKYTDCVCLAGYSRKSTHTPGNLCDQANAMQKCVADGCTGQLHMFA